MRRTPKYDGIADWYDEYQRRAFDAESVVNFLGPGVGRCLDLACGSGIYLESIDATGRDVIGVDLSIDQVRIAKIRKPTVACADAARLPFCGSSFTTVTAFWMSTDVDDIALVLLEAARVLEVSGILYLYGPHPCFNGPFIEPHPDGVVVHTAYRAAGWHDSSPWWGAGIRSRVGMRHVPLAALFNAVADAGFNVVEVVEPGEESVPIALALVASKR